MFTEEEVAYSALDTTNETNTENHENDSTGEGEGETTIKETVERKPETAEQRVARLKRQLEREEKKLGIEGKDSSKESDEVKDSYAEKYNRLALKTEGITDKKEQDIVLDYADYKGIDVEEALQSSVIKAELKEYRDKKSTPAPSTRTSKGGASSVDSLVSKYKAGKYLSPSEMKQVRQKLRG